MEERQVRKVHEELDKINVLAWEEIQHDLYTSEDGFIFGVELDMFNNHMRFYTKYPDGSEVPFFTEDVYRAIDAFNEIVDDERRRNNESTNLRNYDDRKEKCNDR